MRTYSSLGIEKYITLGFLSLILTGTFFLWLFNLLFASSITLLDALFLSTSAVCVTGLSPFDIGTVLSVPSQLVLLTLVQLGGVGIMTATTALMLAMGRRIHFRERLFLAGGLGVSSPQGVVRLLHQVLVYTLSFEAIGTFLLFVGFIGEGMPLHTAFYNAFFHSISAFCNAGFSLFPDNLQSYSLSILLPGTIMLLIVSGGIGFPVMVEIVDYQRGVRPFFSPYAKIVLTATSLLVVMGAVVIILSEWHNAFSALPYWARFWNALFGSVTSRTAGFDTVSISTWSTEGLIALGLFMLIGASPSSTGGGLKTTTFTVLLWSAWKELKQEDDVNIWGRQIASRTIRRALAMAFLYLFTLFFGSSLLSILEEQPFFSLVFEAVSALGTVGLSTGITSDLSSAGKMVIILLMYWGRVGLLTFSYSVVPQEKYAKVYLPETHIPIG